MQHLEPSYLLLRREHQSAGRQRLQGQRQVVLQLDHYNDGPVYRFGADGDAGKEASHS